MTTIRHEDMIKWALTKINKPKKVHKTGSFIVQLFDNDLKIIAEGTFDNGKQSFNFIHMGYHNITYNKLIKLSAAKSILNNNAKYYKITKK